MHAALSYFATHVALAFMSIISILCAVISGFDQGKARRARKKAERKETPFMWGNVIYRCNGVVVLAGRALIFPSGRIAFVKMLPAWVHVVLGGMAGDVTQLKGRHRSPRKLVSDWGFINTHQEAAKQVLTKWVRDNQIILREGAQTNPKEIRGVTVNGTWFCLEIGYLNTNPAPPVSEGNVVPFPNQPEQRGS